MSPILVNDFTIKRAIKTIYDSLGTLANFNPNRIGLNNFNRPRLKSGNDVLKFIGFELIRKVYPNFLSVVSCKNILGRTGNFVVEGIKFYDEYNYLVDNFQLVYPIKIEEKKAKKDDVVDDYAVLKDDLRDIQPSSVLSFGLSAKDGLKEAEKLCPKIEENVNELLELGDVKPIFIPQVVAPNALNHNQSNESGVIRTNNAVFEKKAHIWSDDEVIV